MTQEKKNWAVAFGYVGLIYSTLEIVPVPAQYLRQHGMLRLSLYTLFSLCVLGLLRFLWHLGASKIRMSSLAVILILYVLVARFAGTPEEQIHFIEYGLVAVFFARALSTGRSFNHTIFFQALAISIGAGWIDEIIQGLLPHRYYDIHDVMLNAVSALLGLMIYALFTFHPSTIKKRPEK